MKKSGVDKDRYTKYMTETGGIRKHQGTGRIIILAVFGMTAVISLFYWWFSRAARGDKGEKFWGGLTVKMNFLTEEEKAARKRVEESELFEKRLEEKIKDGSGTYGIFILRLGKDEEYGVNTEIPMPAASIMKLPVMISAMQEIEAGRMSFETEYILENRDKRTGSGSIGTNPVGTVYTMEKLLREMGIKSDNTAYAAVLRKIGQETVQNNISKWGLDKTSIQENLISPREAGKLWKMMFEETILSAESREKMWSFLRDSIYEDRIAKGLPEDTDLVHKVGTDEGVWSDCGIVLGERPYVIVIMTSKTPREEAAAMVPELSRMIWEFENSLQVN